MTIITMLQNSIEDGLSMLNKHTFQIEKFDRSQARGPGGDRSWRNRKDITINEAKKIKGTAYNCKVCWSRAMAYGQGGPVRE